MLKTALLTLTLTTGGEPLMTLSEMETPAACEESRQTITSIFADAGIELITALCGQTALQLTPFMHGATPEEERHRYHIAIDGAGRFDVTPLAANADCQPAPDAIPTIYCARSSQTAVE